MLLTRDRKQPEDYARFEGLLTSTVEDLQQAHANVFIIASVPEVGMDVPTWLARGARTGRSPEALATPYPKFMARQARTLSLLSRVAEKYRVHLVFPDRMLCENDSCRSEKEDRVFYTDSNHLSVQGALVLAPEFYPLLRVNTEINTE